METLLKNIKNCALCSEHLPLGPNPVVTAHKEAKIIIIGQAPGTKVHKSGIPWNDPSGNQLRKWLGMTDEAFYDARNLALMPMGFCYPGKGKSGDLPPRPECAPQWHQKLLDQMPDIKLAVLIGQYAQQHYLGKTIRENLTETVKAFRDYEPFYFPLPHPSPRNRFWLTKNPWFETDVVPVLQERVKSILSDLF